MPGRKSCWIFHGDLYAADLKQSLKDAMGEVTTLLREQILANLESIPFKDNPVKILKSMGVAGKLKKSDVEITSDAKRKYEVMDNIINSRITWTGRSILSAQIRYTSNNFKESHIGIYHEHGIGSNWDGMDAEKMSPKFSSTRKNSGMVASRSRHIDYIGDGKGIWVDLGGNVRITGSKMAGRTDAGFMNYIGEQTKAYHWFSRALDENRDKILGIYNKALKKIHIGNSKYWKFMSNYILGVD